MSPSLVSTIFAPCEELCRVDPSGYRALYLGYLEVVEKFRLGFGGRVSADCEPVSSGLFVGVADESCGVAAGKQDVEAACLKSKKKKEKKKTKRTKAWRKVGCR